MPDVDEIYFCFLWANKAITFIYCKDFCGKIVSEIHCLLNLFSYYYDNFYLKGKIYRGTPFHLTNPPYTERDALPEPNLANYDN